MPVKSQAIYAYKRSLRAGRVDRRQHERMQMRARTSAEVKVFPYGGINGERLSAGTTMLNDRCQIGIRHLIQRAAFGECMWLDFKIVVIRNAIGRRLGIMAAVAILVCEDRTRALLVVSAVSTMSIVAGFPFPGVAALSR